jgi:hypothetical protein
MPSPAIPQGAPGVPNAGWEPGPGPAQAPGQVPAQGQGSPPPGAPRAKGPTTFAEMGIQGVKLEEKECVIM